LGGLIVDALRAKAPSSEIIAIARSPEKVTDLRVAVRHGDYDDPPSVAAALLGVRDLVLVSSNDFGRRAEQHRTVIDAAKAAGVRRIVYTSLLHADRTPLSLAPEHLETERALIASGLAFTILRNGWYLENYAGAVNGALATGTLAGSAGHGRVSAASRADYAAAVVAVLTGLGHDGQTYELAGDSSFELSDLAAELIRQTGRKIAYRDLPEPEYAAALVKEGLPEGIAQAIASWDIGIATGALFDESGQLGRLIGRRTTTLREFVSATLGEELKETG
jgi:NAD(P)H dehydrogenase (quinone)